MKTITFKRLKNKSKHPLEPKRYLYTKSDEETRKEYDECWTLEKKMAKKYKKQLREHSHINTLEECQRICNNLCERLGVQRMPWLYHKPRKAYREASYNSGRHIIFADDQLQLRVILHELAHYIVFREKLMAHGNTSRSHSEDFLWILEVLYDMYFETVC